MNRSTLAPCGATAPVPDNQAPAPDDPQPDEGPQQLELRLFERLDRFRGVPPEKALWRELLDVALGSSETFIENGMTVSAAFLHHVAWALFGRTDRAGIAKITDQDLANDIRRPRSRPRVTAALAVMRRLRISRSTRLNRRGPRLHMLNLGGLDWPAIRRRIAAGARKQSSGPTQLEIPSGLHTRPLGGPSGLHTRQLKGVRTEEQISVSIAAAGTSRASLDDRRQQQPSPEGKRLIDALAGRSREHDLPFAEDAVRRRLAAGNLTNADLRHRLNQLPPRLATLTPEQWAADEAAGLVDRSRRGGYPAPPDDPRFTTEDDPRSG